MLITGVLACGKDVCSVVEQGFESNICIDYMYHIIYTDIDHIYIYMILNVLYVVYLIDDIYCDVWRPGGQTDRQAGKWTDGGWSVGRMDSRSD